MWCIFLNRVHIAAGLDAIYFASFFGCFRVCLDCGMLCDAVTFAVWILFMCFNLCARQYIFSPIQLRIIQNPST